MLLSERITFVKLILLLILT